MAFTVTFNDDGTISKVVDPKGNDVPQGDCKVKGKPIKDLTSISIVTTSNPTTCINQGGVWHCFTT